MFRITLAALVVALLLLPACGSGDDAGATSTIVRGPLTIALPFLPATIGESLLVGFRNLSSSPATVTATAYTAAGAPYPPGSITRTIPAAGSIRVPAATFTGAVQVGGWIFVDTRDVTTLDADGEPTPTAASGFVAAYVQRSETGREIDGALGAAFRDDFGFVSLVPQTLAFQIMNRSYDPLAGGSTPAAMSVDVHEYDAFGGELPGSPTTVVLPAHGSTTFLPLVTTGRAEIMPTPPGPGTTVARIAIAALEADPQVFVEARLLDARRSVGQRFVGFDLEFGIDLAGNEYDFAVVATNASDSGTDETIVLESIYAANGAAILTSPRIIGLDARRTKYLATTTRDSQGLDNTEPSPFADIFGDVASATGIQVFTLTFSVPAGADISARGINAFKSYYRILPGRKLTTDVMVLGIEVPTRTGTGALNLISLMNPRNSAITVNLRGFTPGGTVYFLDPITVNPYSRFDWSPDGMIFTEDPSDPTQSQVPFMAFRFTGQGGMFFNARRDRRDVQELILSIVPHMVRDLSAD